MIVAGFLPIYVLSGPSGRLYSNRWRYTTIFALIGALILTLTVLPVALLLGAGRAAWTEKSATPHLSGSRTATHAISSTGA